MTRTPYKRPTRGARSVAEVEGNVGFLEHAIPADFWAELKQEGLIDAEAPAP